MKYCNIWLKSSSALSVFKVQLLGQVFDGSTHLDFSQSSIIKRAEIMTAALQQFMSLYKPSISVHQTILQTQALAMLRISYYIYNEFKARNLRIFKLNGMLFLVTFQASLNFIYEGIKCLYSILNYYQFMQTRTGYTLKWQQ